MISRSLYAAAFSLSASDVLAETVPDDLFVQGSLDVSGMTTVEELSASHVVSVSSQGNSAFYGRQLGDTFTNTQPVFWAISDHPNGLANWFFRGTIGGPEGTETFSIRADGQIKSANLAGAGTAVLVVGPDGALKRGSAYSVGIGSAAVGSGYAGAANAFSAGSGQATQLGATAVGVGTTASGYYSTAFGAYSTASGNTATAMGWYTSATNEYTTAMGVETRAFGYAATSMGEATLATGYAAFAVGSESEARGGRATAMGLGTLALGDQSFAVGEYTTAQAYGSFALGRYNIIQGDLNNWVGTDDLFVIGNGSAFNARANAFSIKKNGNMWVAGDAKVQGDLVVSHVISNSSQGNSAFLGTQVGAGFSNPLAIYTANTENPTPGSINYFFKGVKAGEETVLIDSDGSATFGKGRAAIRSWTVPVTADGPIALTNGTNRWNGIYILNWEGPGRSHNIVFAATGQQYQGASITVLSERAYNGAPVMTDLRIMQSDDGASQQLVVTVVNRNGGAGNATVSYYGSEPNVSFPRDQVLYSNRVSTVSNLTGSGPISTGNVGIGDSVAALSPAWKSAEVVGQIGLDKIVVGPLISTYSGATVGAHNSSLTVWTDLNVAGANLIFRTNGETEAARLTSSGNLGLGTASPVSRLTLAGGGNLNPNVNAEVDYVGQNLTFQGINAGGTYTLGGIKMVQPTGYYVDNADMVFSTSKGGPFSEDMRIKGGKLGVGTNAPSAKLDVSGDAKVSGTVTAGKIRVPESGDLSMGTFTAHDGLPSL